MFNQIVANVKYNTVYVCAACGRRQIGDTNRATVVAASPEQFTAALRTTRQTPASMPQGWSYNGAYNCGCQRREH